MTRASLVLPPLALLSAAAWSLTPPAHQTAGAPIHARRRVPPYHHHHARPASSSRSALAAVKLQLDGLGGPLEAPAVATQWDDSSFGGGDTLAAPAALAAPARRTNKLIETYKVGIVSGPYKRRRGIHAEVLVAHPEAGLPDSMHRLWFGFEVLDDVARLRGFSGREVDIERFSEAVVEFLQQQGVDLSDPDWGMDDDSVPFSVEHLPLRTLFAYYEELPQHLADVVLGDYVPPPPAIPEEGEGDVAKVPVHALEDPDDFPCLGALGWGANFTAMGIGDESHAKPLSYDYYKHGSN